ncbi:MAG: DUF1203 domain-containing protein [Pyrinomonadaceae bacterium]|nr:DUF1203 domain-containing protein [Pyrinomonadaceae bacterium]
MYKVVALSDEIVSKVRGQMVSPQYPSLAAARSLANGYGPCRSCLKVFDQGNEDRIFFTYNSFEGVSDLPDPGPVFVHADECSRFDGRFPENLLELPLLLEAFGPDSVMISRYELDRERYEEQIAELFAVDGVRMINLRNAEAGCFVARIERQ